MADATTLAPNPDLQISGVGLDMTIGGTGLEIAGTGVISVDIGGPVLEARLYWAGRDRPCVKDNGGCILSSADDEMLFDGNALVGELVGTEVSESGPLARSNNVGYAADVTDIVAEAVSSGGTGVHAFSVADNDAEDMGRLNGAGLLVIFTDPSDAASYQITVYEGLDFAYHGASPAPAKVTEPVTFSYTASDSDRDVEIAIMVGDAEENRPGRITIDGAINIDDELNGDDGTQFDADVFNHTVVAGNSETTIELFSTATGGVSGNPDSMLWITGILRFPFENPAIDIEKFTLVEPPPVDGGACEVVGKPVIFTMMYTGDGNPISHSQASGKVSITGLTGDAEPPGVAVPVCGPDGSHFHRL